MNAEYKLFAQRRPHEYYAWLDLISTGNAQPLNGVLRGGDCLIVQSCTRSKLKNNELQSYLFYEFGERLCNLDADHVSYKLLTVEFRKPDRLAM